MGACDRAPVCAVGHVQVMQATMRQRRGALAQRQRMRTPIRRANDFDALSCATAAMRCSRLASRARARATTSSRRVSDAGLRGLGGAGFPTGRKWTLVRAEPAPRLMAVNADEGEPGTFKDRYYLERDPHRFLEGMLIAAWVVEATRRLHLSARRVSRSSG